MQGTLFPVTGLPSDYASPRQETKKSTLQKLKISNSNWVVTDGEGQEAMRCCAVLGTWREEPLHFVFLTLTYPILVRLTHMRNSSWEGQDLDSIEMHTSTSLPPIDRCLDGFAWCFFCGPCVNLCDGFDLRARFSASSYQCLARQIVALLSFGGACLRKSSRTAKSNVLDPQFEARSSLFKFGLWSSSRG